MDSLSRVVTDRYSTFRTTHEFAAYAEFTTLEEFAGLLELAKRARRKVYILGNGSNTLFIRKHIKTAVLRNKLTRTVEVMPDNRMRVTSSVMVATILQHCRTKRLESFYYLASVPATIGGAVAMNAGRGRQYNQTIFDFLESITWYECGRVQTANANDILRDYRHTPFTGCTPKLILEVVFRFFPSRHDDDKIAERIRYSKDVQDHSAANCGTVFKKANYRIMSRLCGLRLRSACYSSKTTNWILSTGKNSLPIVGLVRIAQFLHRLTWRQCLLELIEVD
jgi:UDP-N-acetylmuramate dehydrogenase